MDRASFLLCAALLTLSTTVRSEVPDEASVLRYLETHPDFLDRHPELAARAAEMRVQRMRAQSRTMVHSALASRRALLDSPLLGRAGTGDLLIVEFFDYRCPPCRASHPALQTLLHEDPGVRLVYLPLPLFGEESELAAKAAFAAQLQGRFLPMHDWLITAPLIDRRALIAAASQRGLDVDRLLADLADPRLAALIGETQSLAKMLKVEGPPAFVVGDLLIHGGIDAPALRKAVRLARCLAPLPAGSAADSACLEQAR